MARPSAFTPAAQEAVVTAVTAGNTRSTAAAYAGVARSTLQRWLARGKKARRGAFRDFWDRLKKAEAEAVIRNVAIVQKAAEKQWQAAAWWLERRRYDDWALRDKGKLAELSETVRKLEVDIHALTLAQARAAAKAQTGSDAQLGANGRPGR
jgi:transposase